MYDVKFPYEKAKQFCELFCEDIPTSQRGHDNDYTDTDGKCTVKATVLSVLTLTIKE